MYRVIFPPNTVRVNGLVMLRSSPFVITFPDLFVLHGAELWPLDNREPERCINSLYLDPRSI
jgi:hypothetical protein